MCVHVCLCLMVAKVKCENVLDLYPSQCYCATKQTTVPRLVGCLNWRIQMSAWPRCGYLSVEQKASSKDRNTRILPSTLPSYTVRLRFILWQTYRRTHNHTLSMMLCWCALVAHREPWNHCILMDKRLAWHTKYILPRTRRTVLLLDRTKLSWSCTPLPK